MQNDNTIQNVATSSKYVNIVLNVHRNHQGRRGKRRGGGQVGEREIIYLSLHCQHQNDSCIKMGGDESHFNVSLIVRDNLKSQDSVHRTQFLKRNEGRSGFEPRSLCLPA